MRVVPKVSHALEHLTIVLNPRSFELLYAHPLLHVMDWPTIACEDQVTNLKER